MPLWEENVRSGCDVNFYPYSSLFDIGRGRVAFRMTNAYVVKEPSLTPLHSIYPLNPAFEATVELGTAWSPENEPAVLSKQNVLPVTAFLLADQAGALSLGPAYLYSLYFTGSTPTYFSFGGGAIAPGVGTYSGRVPVLISNSSNPPVVASYRISVVNPYPLKASVDSLTFTCHVGGAVPAPQSFSLTKQGKPLGVGFQQLPYPSWLKFQNSDNTAPETITITVDPSGLAAGTYTANIVLGYYSSTTGTVTVPVTLEVLGVPSVAGVWDAESANLAVVPGEWVAIYGTNLSASTRTWTASDFAGNALPLSLDGTNVQFGGAPAAVYYVSPTQIDVQVPSGASGDLPVIVTSYGTATAPFIVSIAQHAPSFFVYEAGSNTYPAATHADGALIGDPAVQPGATKAKPGESIVLYVNGLTASPGGTVIAVPVPYTDPIAVTIGAKNASVSFAGLVAAGQFQVNVVVPPDLATGNYPISIATAGQTSPGTVILPVQ